MTRRYKNLPGVFHVDGVADGPAAEPPGPNGR